MFDRYIVLVMLQVLSPVPVRLYNKNGNKPKCGKACSYLEYIYIYIPHAFLDQGKCHTPSHWRIN